MPKQYELTQKEASDLRDQLAMINHYQKIVDSLKIQWNYLLVDGVFKRLKIEPSKMEYSIADLNNGTLVIDEPEKEPEKPKTDVQSNSK